MQSLIGMDKNNFLYRSSETNVLMNQFNFKLFQFSGVFPYTYNTNRLKFSNFMYGWSILITSFLLSISIKRSFYYYEDNTTTYTQVFAMLMNWEPYFPLIEFSLSSIPIYTSMKQLQKYIQNLVSLRQCSAGSNLRTMTSVIFMMAECCLLVINLQVIYFPTVEEVGDTIDGMCAVIQTIFRTVHLIHFYVALNAMFEHLKKVERDLKKGKLKTVFAEYYKVMDTYERFGMIFQFSMRFSMFNVFYDTMTGVRKLQDILFGYYGVDNQSSQIETVILFWQFFFCSTVDDCSP